MSQTKEEFDSKFVNTNKSGFYLSVWWNEDAQNPVSDLKEEIKQIGVFEFENLDEKCNKNKTYFEMENWGSTKIILFLEKLEESIRNKKLKAIYADHGTSPKENEVIICIRRNNQFIYKGE